MERTKEIEELMLRLKSHGVEKASAPMVSLMVDEGNKRARLIEWLDENPKADDLEVLSQARALMKEDVEGE